jgi:hypothetical protein
MPVHCIGQIWPTWLKSVSGDAATAICLLSQISAPSLSLPSRLSQRLCPRPFVVDHPSRYPLIRISISPLTSPCSPLLYFFRRPWLSRFSPTPMARALTRVTRTTFSASSQPLGSNAMTTTRTPCLSATRRTRRRRSRLARLRGSRYSPRPLRIRRRCPKLGRTRSPPPLLRRLSPISPPALSTLSTARYTCLLWTPTARAASAPLRTSAASLVTFGMRRQAFSV